MSTLPPLPPADPRLDPNLDPHHGHDHAPVGEASLLDPAHQSLSDAIRITFRILQLAMVVLAGLFFLSGFQSVKEGEQGIRLLFGKVDAAKLDPGFRFSFPYPVGELVKVSTGAVNLSIDRAFWPYVEDRSRSLSIDQLPASSSLNPANDGSLLTADNNIAHAQWSVVYQRREPERFAQNVFIEDEKSLVMAAVQRGIVHATAQVTIDDLLKQSAGDSGSVASRAREIAQQMLDKAQSGIEIAQLALDQKMPPLYVRGKFNNVQAAASNASKAREQAETARQRILSAKAGAAVDALLAGIDEYERAVELKDAAAKDSALARINALLEGRVADGPAPSGEVTTLLSEARQYRADVVNRAQADLAIFRAKLEQFESNPLVMVHREIIDAISAFANRDSVQLLQLPPGTSTLELVLNADPDLLKQMDESQKRREADAAALRRTQQQRAAQFKTDTGLLQATPQ